MEINEAIAHQGSKNYVPNNNISKVQEHKIMWESATAGDDDIELIRTAFNNISLPIGNELVRQLGFRVKQDAEEISILVPIKDTAGELVAVQRKIFRNGIFMSNLIKGKNTVDACFSFGMGKDVIIFNGLENALSWYLHDDDADLHTYLVVFTWTGFLRLNGFINQYENRLLILDNTKENLRVLKGTEILSGLNVMRMQHPKYEYGCWQAAKEDNFKEWKSELQEIAYSNVVELKDESKLDVQVTADQYTDASEAEIDIHEMINEPMLCASPELSVPLIDIKEIHETQQLSAIENEPVCEAILAGEVNPQSELRQLEEKIEEASAVSYKHFLVVGKALWTIKEKKLYQH